ncbi:MAG: PQQ-dependent sugar dehydrogenase [Acidobacteriota bacterium]|nr:PQQ-dependent sugar dehydrogenase [Acidobacteriota bacterium]
MDVQQVRRPGSRVAWTAAALLVLSGCGGSSPPPATPSPVPGASTVNGSERLAWSQDGDGANLRFVAHVDDNPVALDAACTGTAPQRECSAPLPPLTEGMHRIAVAAVSASGLESERSEPITVQKIAARSVVSAASFPDARLTKSGAGLEAVVTAADGRVFAVDVVARDLQAPMQLVTTPDGRVLVAEADGRVRVIRPGEPMREASALEAVALLDPPPMGPLGLAIHPDFASNHLVYLAFLAQEQPQRTRLRIVRMREVGDILGEPATLFEAQLAVAAEDRLPTSAPADRLSADGPRLAFGPDGLLYVLLPPGAEFDHEPSASVPVASMLRLEDDGRVPDAGPLLGITVHPLGFTWHPSTAALWVIAPGDNGAAVLRTVTHDPTSHVDEIGVAVLRLTNSGGPESAAVVFEATATTSALAGLFAEDLDPASFKTVRLATPFLIESVLSGMSGRIGDAVGNSGGTLFLATSNHVGLEARPGAGADVIVRLSPRAP